MSSAHPPSVAAEKKALQAKLQDQERELGELRREAKAAAAQIKTATQQGELHRQELEKARRAAEALAADKQQLTLAQRTADREVQAMRLELKRALMVQQHMLQQQLNATAAVAEGASTLASHTPPHSVAAASSSSSMALGTETLQAGDARPSTASRRGRVSLLGTAHATQRPLSAASSTSSSARHSANSSPQLSGIVSSRHALSISLSTTALQSSAPTQSPSTSSAPSSSTSEPLDGADNAGADSESNSGEAAAHAAEHASLKRENELLRSEIARLRRAFSGDLLAAPISATSSSSLRSRSPAAASAPGSGSGSGLASSRPTTAAAARTGAALASQQRSASSSSPSVSPLPHKHQHSVSSPLFSSSSSSAAASASPSLQSAQSPSQSSSSLTHHGSGPSVRRSHSGSGSGIGSISVNGASVSNNAALMASPSGIPRPRQRVLSDDDRALLDLLPEAAVASLSSLSISKSASLETFSLSSAGAGRSISGTVHGPAESSHQNSLNSAVFSTIASSSSPSDMPSSLSSPLTSQQLRAQLNVALCRIQELQSQLDQHATTTAFSASQSPSSSPLPSSSAPASALAHVDVSRPLDEANAPTFEAPTAETSTAQTHIYESHATALLLRAEQDAHAQTLAALGELREQYRQQQDAIVQSKQVQLQQIEQQKHVSESLEQQLVSARTAAADSMANLQPWQARCKMLEQNIVELHRAADEAARRAAARPAANRALEVERDQLRHEIDDYKYAIYYGDTQKDRECDERLAAARETQSALEAELRGKIDECDKLQQRLRLTQERALDEWMFDGQSDLI